LGIQEKPQQSILGVRQGALMDQIGDQMMKDYEIVNAKVAEKPAIAAAMYHTTSDLRKRWLDYTAGYLGELEIVPAGIQQDSIPGGRFFVVRHTGEMKFIGNAWSGGIQVMRYKKIKMAKRPGFEIYVSGFDEDGPETVTDVYLAVK
ncbi:MAG: GyrI-like domain-containing protein, partial [Planctomycetota bacterium]